MKNKLIPFIVFFLRENNNKTMDTYFLIYMCVVLVYGIYLCVTSDEYQISSEVNDDSVKPQNKYLFPNTNLRTDNYSYTDVEKNYNYQRKMI